jgi:hypothetical protein
MQAMDSDQVAFQDQYDDLITTIISIDHSDCRFVVILIQKYLKTDGVERCLDIYPMVRNGQVVHKTEIRKE